VGNLAQARQKTFPPSFSSFWDSRCLPRLCARIGLNPNSANGVDELAATLGQQMKHGPSVLNILEIIFVLFLLLAPWAA